MHSRIHGGSLAALIACAIVLVTGCTSGPSGGETKSTAPSAPQSPVARPAPVAATAPMTEGQRQAAMLSEADLPDEWHKLAPDVGRNTLPVSDPVCRPLASLMEDMFWGPQATAGNWFRHGGGEAHISTRVVAYPGSGAMAHVVGVRDALDACPAFTSSLKGTAMNVSASRLSAPRFAADSEAFRLSAGRQGGPLHIQTDVVVLSHGAEVLSFQYTPSDPSGHENFEPLARLATDKFMKATHD